jgi:hypothetical protein
MTAAIFFIWGINPFHEFSHGRRYSSVPKSAPLEKRDEHAGNCRSRSHSLELSKAMAHATYAPA